MAVLKIPLIEVCELLNQNLSNEIFSEIHPLDDKICFKLKTSLSLPEYLKLNLSLISFRDGKAYFTLGGAGVKILSRIKAVQTLVQNTLSEFQFIELDLPEIQIDSDLLIDNYIKGVKVNEFSIEHDELLLYLKIT